MVRVSLPVSVFQILIVLSPLVLMSDLLSVANASAVMGGTMLEPLTPAPPL